MFVQLLCTVLVIINLCDDVSAAGRPRHIVFIVADDLGWNDIGFHNPDIITPNIDKLAREGLLLNHHYVQPLCSPSRAAFMSGYYPFKTGLQHEVILNNQPVCLPLNITTLPQKLKELGYATHMVGKWHNGFCSWNCTPTYRGFDSFFGYYNALEDYYTHVTGGFLDYRNNTSPVTTDNGTYSTLRFTDVATDIIERHNQSQPLFLYLAYQAVHEPIEVPAKYEAMYPNIKTENRRKFSGMVSALDEAVGNVTETLKQRGLMDDTLILFTADNGGAVDAYGNNYPLRGGKFTLYEGGTRAVGFMYGSGLQKTGTVFDGMIHAVDWLPTLTAAAGGTPVSDRDGINLWPSLSTASPSPRTEVVYNYDSHPQPMQGHAAIRVGDYKLIDGYPGLYPGWYKPEQVTSSLNTRFSRDSANQYQLFNLKDDPNERNDLSNSRPDMVKKLAARLAWYEKQAVPPNFPETPNDLSNPALYGNVWSPGWC
ncbi:arylsulfatase B-like [Haliotis rufescens]|uniref:arylsulfatase B-like n=1 Tax=Haliotis rufescens TaxID=6454 RepID=UPI001EAFD46A|nr:arylsulfatase B-like [Haliotis rufescens]